jgi:hypothetical protein
MLVELTETPRPLQEKSKEKWRGRKTLTAAKIRATKVNLATGTSANALNNLREKADK